jgi:ATP-dependent exoDNAse (exonuclease V) beta subunit
MNQNPPVDAALRARFAEETDRNFSLICPAGSGKTHSIVDRVVALARRTDAAQILRPLVVVTFTKKAAEEMQARARAAVMSGGFAGPVRAAFDQAFFGTIHAYAVLLLESFGHHLGVPAAFEVSEDLGVLWTGFLRDWRGQEAIWQQARVRRLLRFVSMQEILTLAQKWDFARPLPAAEEAPGLDLRSVYSFPLPKRQDTAANIQSFRTALRTWESEWTSPDGGFAPVPVPTKGGKEFIAAATAALAPVRAWVNNEAAALACDIAEAFRLHRIKAGVLTFDDQVGLAARLVRHPAAIAEIRRRRYRVILDEAQDTDPQQFDILLEVARPEQAATPWATGEMPPEGGRFSMVGDLEQAIYRERADLATYRRVHEYLTRTPAGEALTYAVTFRCGRAVTDFANRIFPSVLNGQRGQVDFVRLEPRAGAAAGQVLGWEVPAPGRGDIPPEGWEAEQLAGWLKNIGLAGLQARRWGEVALLCPRKRWFGALRDALHAQGLKTQMLSNRETLAESAAFAWTAALATVMAEPRNGFELVGVLREIFGLSDHDLAFFARSDGRRFQLCTPVAGDGAVETTLRRLHYLRERIVGMPVAAAARLLETEVLGARIAILPNAARLREDLETAMAVAAQVGANDRGLAEWAAHLRSLLRSAPEEGAREPDSIAIVTNMKAKGLEWDAIVVPYLFREIRDRAEEYPRLLGERGEAATAAFAKEDVTAAAAEKDLSCARRELARLAYVTCTRARRTLVLAVDRHLWCGDAMEVDSIAGALRLDAENQAVLRGLTATPRDDGAADPGRQRGRPAAPAIAPLEAAVAAAAKFSRQITPHRLARGFTPDEPEVRAMNPDRQARLEGRDYGVWWHNLMRDLPWTGGVAAWRDAGATALTQCPDAERGRQEFGRFLESPLAARLSAPGVTVLVEVPFHAALKDGAILEGVIDLCALNAARDRWHLVDWKAIEADHRPETAVERYAAQIEAYRTALQGITGLPADASLYLTPSGEIPLAA